MKAVVFDLSGTLLDVREGRYQLIAGADELLPILKRLGLKLIAFAPNDATGVTYLQHFGVDRHFHTVIAEQPQEGTSHSEGLASLLQDMNVAPHETVVVGNSVANIQLGKSVHSAKVIGISYELNNAQALLDAGADHIVTDIAAVLDVLE